MSNRQLDELNEAQSDKKIAELLGITIDEYNSLKHNGIQDDSSDEGLIYRYYIQFTDDSPSEILTKINGIDSTNTFYFGANDFD